MKKVLLIEDDRDQISMYQYVFEREHYEFISAQSIEEGLTLSREKKPDIILLDLLIRETTKTNGLDVLKKLKSDEKTKNIPVIILTNYGAAKAKEDSLAFGAVDFILKTEINPGDLVNKVEQVIS